MAITVCSHGVYSSNTHAQVQGTLALFRHLHAFLASDCSGMRDPFAKQKWGFAAEGDVWDKARTQREIKKMIDTAINRKASAQGALSRKYDPDYQRWLWLDAQEANTPRLIIRHFRTKELNTRLKHRLFTEDICD